MALPLFAIMAILLYALAAAGCLQELLGQRGVVRRIAIPAGTAGLLLHALALYRAGVTAAGITLNLVNATSLLVWVSALLATAGVRLQPIGSLRILLYPAAAFSLLPVLTFPAKAVTLPAYLPLGTRIHLSLSILALGLLVLAGLQALLLAVQERGLHTRQPLRVLQLLPPLQAMENLLFQVIVAGFFVLSLSLVTGLMFPRDLSSSPLAQKTLLSLLAWLIFGVLLWGRWLRGWRGQRAATWTLGGCAVLTLAYFGSKLLA